MGITLTDLLSDPQIVRILSLDGRSRAWMEDFERLQSGDRSLTRKSAGEQSIKSMQRLMIFLGYSTASTGAFLIDGDFGRGTNRGVAQFQLEHGISRKVPRHALCYPCHFSNARQRIVSIPDTTLDTTTLVAMLESARRAIDNGEIAFGDFDEALFHLNQLHRHRYLSCAEIATRYGAYVRSSVAEIATADDVAIAPEWVMAVIKQETSGVVRPRFEQHKLSRFNEREPRTNLGELRHRSMSIGLGQIMGYHYERVGAATARSMLFSPIRDQILYVARFLALGRSIRTSLAKRDPDGEDFARVARYYNGPKYANHFYDERLARWFREFRLLAG